MSSAKGLGMEKRAEESHVLEVFKVGYEVYADGATRVLRICEGADSFKEEKVLQPRISFQIRVSNFVIQLIEKNKQVRVLLQYFPSKSSIGILELIYLFSI